MLVKRKQIERITIAPSLLESVWDEVVEGDVEDDDLLQAVTNAQVYVNRLSWKLNERNNSHV
jgi:hypothetical protein